MVDDETLKIEVLKLHMFKDNQQEKAAIILTVRDLLEETDKLKTLNTTFYEMGDQISLIPLISEKVVLSVNGILEEDASTIQEDYSDGVENEDLIHNVRFIIRENGLATLYNEAPVIEGVEDISVSDFDSFDPRQGVLIKDDHDQDLSECLLINIEQIDEINQQIKYQVTDSWGRTTEVIRLVKKESVEQELDSSVSAQTENTTLADNTITIRGIRFSGDGADTDLRFRLQFDTRTQKIKVIDQDGRSMDSRVQGTYFRLVLYQADGTIKKQVELLGSDRSNSSKLDELKYGGWRYDYGDYISLYHYQPERKLGIAGTVQNKPEDISSFETGVPHEILSKNRFKLTSSGLSFTSNQAPTITFDSDPLRLTRGEAYNLFDGVTIEDDFGIESKDVVGYHNEIGTYTLTYTVTDNWGVATKKTRQLIILPKSEIEEISIRFYSSNNQPMFTLQFDEIFHEFKLTDVNDETIQVNPNNKQTELTISVFTADNKLRRTFNILGTDTVTSKNIQNLMFFDYMPGDYIRIVPNDPTKVRIEVPTKTDYDAANSLEALDGFKNGRFQLTGEGEFKYIYNEAAIITAPDLMVNRGEEINIFENLIIKDDHDQNIVPSEQNTKVRVISGNVANTGEIIYELTYTDSWGRTTTTTRKVIIVGNSPIENKHFNLLNEKNETILTFSLDSVTNKFLLIFGDSQNYIEGNSDDVALELKTYDSNHQLLGTFDLNYNEVIDAKVESTLENLSFEEGGYFTLKAYHYDAIEMFSIDQESSSQLEQQILPNQNQLFDDEDQMLYSRVEISNETGLVKKYNHAPKILGATDIKVVYGTDFDENYDVIVSDVDQNNVPLVIKGEVKTDEFGTYQLIYSATDEYGRKAEAIRTVTVIPVYTTNEIQYRNADKNLAFSIGINEAGTGFIFNSLSEADDDQENMLDERQNLELTASQDQSEHSILQRVLFEFTVYNQNHQLQNKIEIIDDENNSITLKVTNQTNDETISALTNVEQLKEVIASIQVRPDYYFSINASDLSQLRLIGQLDKKSQSEVESVNYEQLTDEDRDVVENVRFKLTENIVEVEYNQAPVIQIQPTSSDETSRIESSVSNTIERSKALTKEAYDLLSDVVVSDDKDNLTLTVEHVTVADEMLVSDLESSIATIGQTYDVTYQIQDSWGRASESVTRQVTIKSAMDDTKIKYHRAGGSLQDSGLAVTIGFNMQTKRLTFDVVSNNNTFKDPTNAAYGTLIITHPNGTSEYKKIFGQSNNTVEQPSEFTNGITNQPSVVQEDLENFEIPYGTKFKFEMMQIPHLFIDGSVVNAQEDYSQGAKLGAVLKQSTFVVTPEGLKQEYNGIIVDETKSQLTWLNGVAGGQSANVKLNTSNPDSLTFDVDYYGTEPLDTMYRDKLFDIIINDEKSYPINARHYPERFHKVFIAGDTNSNPPTVPIESVAPGDYMRISGLVERRLSNLKFYNLCEGYYFPEEVDYSKVITNREYFDHVRFYFGTQGITPVYNAAPVFEGADETDIIVGDIFDVEDGVRVIDEFDNAIGETVTYTVSPETIDTSRVGRQIVTYTATDSWGRTTTHDRVINIRPKVFDNKIQVFAESDKINPAFEILLKNSNTQESTRSLVLGHYQVNRFLNNTMLDENNPTEAVFKIWVMDASNTPKESIILLGRDTATSEKLNVLEEVEYEAGDYIKVWRLPSVTSNDDKIDTLKITGTIRGENGQDYHEGSFNVEYMNNVVFQVPVSNEENLKAIYNQAPRFEGLADKIIYYGDTFNALDHVSVTDDKTTDLTLSDQNVSHNVNANRIGSYPVTYMFTDSWGRTTTQTITVKVISKVTQNTIEVYGDTENGQNELKFTIGFNEDANYLTFKPNDNVTVTQLNHEGNSSAEIMSLTVYNRFGNIKKQILITSEDTIDSVTQKFEELSQVAIMNTDSLSISHQNPSNVKIKGTIHEQSQDYSTGIASSDVMKGRRFRFLNTGLTETRSDGNQVVFNGLKDLTIKRGDDVNLLDGVSVEHTSEIFEEIMIDGFDNKKVGTQTVTYKVVDSWGVEFTDTRNIIVLPYNSLETVQVEVESRTNHSSDVLQLEFDAIDMKMIPKLNPNKSNVFKYFDKLIEFIGLDSRFDDEMNHEILQLAIFNDRGYEKSRISLTQTDLLDSSNLEIMFEDLSFEYGDLIGIETYSDYEYLMNGPVIVPMDESINQKNMTQLRYYITEDGLTAVHNEAPVISANDIEHQVGEHFDFNSAITFQDDHDGTTISDIWFESDDYDEYIPGKYEVTYFVYDSWGLLSMATAYISVRSDIEDSFIKLKSEQGQELIKLGFDSVTRRLTWSYYEDETIPVTNHNDETKLFEISIYNDQNIQQGTAVPIYGKDTVATLKTKLALLQWYQYTYGNQIHIEVAECATSLASITNVLTVGSPQLEGVDYEQGVQDLDFFTNVRFQVMYDALYAIYNEAPVVNVTQATIESEKKINADDYELLNKVVAKDDKDDSEDIRIQVEYYNATYPDDTSVQRLEREGSYNENNLDDPKNPKRLRLGKNTIKYIAIDSWGRKSEPKTATLNLISAMDNIEIKFLYAANGLMPDMNQVAMTIKFDMENGRLVVENQSPTGNFKFNHIQYGAMYLKNSSGEYLERFTMGVNNKYESNNEFQEGNFTAYKSNVVNDIKAKLEKHSIDYGYEFKIKIYQSPFVYINGQVNNAQEDYSQGAKIAEFLNQSTFVITEEGLVQKYEPNIKPEEHHNTIAWYSGVSGNLQFKLNVNPQTQQLTVDQVDPEEQLDTLYTVNDDLFSIYVYNAQGEVKHGDTFTSRQQTNAIYNALNGRSFSIADGDYMEIKILPTNRDRKLNFRIFGDVKRNQESLNQIDYTSGVPDVSYYNAARFYFTNEGLRLDYNEAPVFTGLTDIILLKSGEQQVTVNLKENVKVMDDNTPNISYTILDSSGQEIPNPENYSPESSGALEVYYMATDSLGRTTKEPRFIWLQSPSEIEVNDENKLIVQEADPTLRDEASVYDYLINLVTVYDYEDDEIHVDGKGIIVTKDNIETDFNPMQTGEYNVTYTVFDSDGNKTTKTIKVTVVRSINVSVPLNNIPFQVVTNLLRVESENPDNEQVITDLNGNGATGDEFISGTVKIKNNYFTDVNVSVKSLTVSSEIPTNSNGNFTLVDPANINWDDLSEEETMTQMALGLYSKSGLTGDNLPTKDSPIWLTTDINKTSIGVLPKRTFESEESNEAVLSFTAKYGKKFTSGKHKMKFSMVLEFE